MVGKRCGSHLCVCFWHLSASRYLGGGALSSAVSGILSDEVLALEGPGKDRSEKSPHSAKFLEVSVKLGRASAYLLPCIICDFFLEPLDMRPLYKWPLSFSELIFL